ncbi:Elongator subunit elp4 [Elasticomyces elasticus]|nr:Elongator subunit elp4 [Elasticomyces elasticus]KAK3639007.1 Elongator subunit elp4 [Elasticomyces elasticus]KAK4918739.1 Elongator subunit elp4 [Elasticomyces elasticus]KAK5754432.1 Elongator subunit elp4 [Elasticomyces elasticus]
MAFRKRNVPLGRGPSISADNSPQLEHVPGIRPSPLTSQSVTSTGTPSLDDLLGGHSGLALGSSLLIEESGTTDFAGALLKFYAAEGICQGHIVHVIGVDTSWIRDLPGTADEKSSRRKAVSTDADEKMKIAWRYESLGQTGERGAFAPKRKSNVSYFYAQLMVSTAAPIRGLSSQDSTALQTPFSHAFDLSKRLVIPTDAKINVIPVGSLQKPFDTVLQSFKQALKSSPPQSVHRLVIPSMLSPAMWPPEASRPENMLRFMHSLRALLAQYPSRMTAIITLPLELFPRNLGIVRWAELFCDGVLELTPFPHLMDASNSGPDGSGTKGTEEQPQGMLRVHKLPIDTERGEGGAGAGSSMGADLAFTVSRRKFLIKPFSLPPVEGDQDAQKDAGKLTGKEIEF